MRVILEHYHDCGFFLYWNTYENTELRVLFPYWAVKKHNLEEKKICQEDLLRCPTTPPKIKISFPPLQSLKHLLILFYLSLCCLMIVKKKGVNQNEKQWKMTTSVVTSLEKGWLPHSLLCNKFWGTHMQLLHWCLCICNPLWHSMLLSLHCTISPATKHS